MTMTVLTRTGRREPVRFDAVLERLQGLMEGLDTQHVDAARVAKEVIRHMNDGITTRQLDELAAEHCAALMSLHPDYGRLGARILATDLHKAAPPTFSQAVSRLHAHVDEHTGRPAPLVSDELHDLAQEHAERIDAAIDPERDLSFDYFGLKTLLRGYLLRCGTEVVETPQYLWMRVALGIHGDDLDAALQSYDYLSRGLFTHATPTLFNAGTPRPQLSSCFLLAMREDSMEGIMDTLRDCALISKSSGGLGLHVSNIRSKGSLIRGTNGRSNGIVPMLRVFNNLVRYVDQGGGKRKGALAVYLEPWHPEVFEFLELRKNHGSEEHRARDLFYALWIPDLFMQRVEADEPWSLLDPDDCPGLQDAYGDAFRDLYERYESEGRARRVVPARQLWSAILDAQVETGTPYMLYKDHANQKSNQAHVGTIKSSNLCTEIMQVSTPEETAVCNLASIALPKFVTQEGFDHTAFHEVVRHVVVNLNRVIDRNHYPTPEARLSNHRHRPIGLGVQGLADTFALLDLPFDSWEARELNKQIFESLYHAALTASVEQAEQDGAHESFAGSPASHGLLQFDLWNVTPDSGRYDWDQLRAEVQRHGLRNSLLVAPMPTASTSQILGNTECFEPFTSNLYTRRTLSGEFVVVNRHLVRDLSALGLWGPMLKDRIVANHGSIQGLEEVPAHLREKYRTAWEIRQRVVVDMAADRAPFVDQSQSLNIHMAEPTHAKLTSLHFHAWRRGLKTGMYYLRTRAAAAPLQFTLPAASPSRPAQGMADACGMEEGCETCSA